VGHLRRYDQAMMMKAVSSAGFQVINMRYWGLSMLPLLSVRKSMVQNAKPSEETIRRGFQPPGEMANRIMKIVMALETSLWKRPPSGSSLLAVVRS
jgi:hypothetical protein